MGRVDLVYCTIDFVHCPWYNAIMKLTNKLNLPQPLVKAVANDAYDKGHSDISVTSLLKPVQLKALEERYSEELSEDVSDRIWSLLGQVVHGILERAEETAIAERRLYVDVFPQSGVIVAAGDGTVPKSEAAVRIGGEMDRFCLKEGLLQDYKVTTVYKLRDGVPEDFVKQLNIYALILRANGEAVNKLEVVGILRDWSKGATLRDESYPEQQVVVMDVPLISDAEVAAYVVERTRLHWAAKSLKDGELPPCSKEERWAKDDVYAIMKPGRKTAVRLCNSPEGAALAMEDLPPGHFIAFRPGKSTRCEMYCPVRDKCSQFAEMKRLQTENKGDSDNE